MTQANDRAASAAPVVVYVRSVSGSETELVAQARACVEFAGGRGWEVAAVYQDVGALGQGFEAMLADAPSLDALAVVVADAGRLGRDTAAWSAAADRITDKGLLLAAAGQGGGGADVALYRLLSGLSGPAGADEGGRRQ